MNAQIIVIVAGLILLAAIIGSIFFLRGHDSRFTFDTQNGTKPRASECRVQWPVQDACCFRRGGIRRHHRQVVVHADGLFRPL